MTLRAHQRGRAPQPQRHEQEQRQYQRRREESDVEEARSYRSRERTEQVAGMLATSLEAEIDEALEENAVELERTALKPWPEDNPDPSEDEDY